MSIGAWRTNEIMRQHYCLVQGLVTMVHPKQNRSMAGTTGALGGSAEGESLHSREGSLGSILATHSRRFHEILLAVLDNKTTLEPKIDTLRIDMGLITDDRKKLKERLKTTESNLASLVPPVSDANAHIRALQDEVAHFRQRADDQEG
ncbi:hypothetical protein NDU88_001055 [Pleurodeles waltl]|uniref:Uncharacterized protein n=1 Tax=Pleurodeles waltl TaxID=8319 RepID=A0AAV7P6U3_PLEWA|nr:hypothetical protein NDU88_001055 [Pleurodeles waltl]